jgi:hypothetical protein
VVAAKPVAHDLLRCYSSIQFAPNHGKTAEGKSMATKKAGGDKKKAAEKAPAKKAADKKPAKKK